MRPTADRVYLDMCNVLRERATCLRAKHAAILVDRLGHVLSMGYNGAPHGLSHCLDVGCLMEDNHCVRTLHAEMNMLLWGNATNYDRLTVYVTSRPCIRCAVAMIQAGVQRIVTDGRNELYASDYQLNDQMMEMFALSHVDYEVFRGN